MIVNFKDEVFIGAGTNLCRLLLFLTDSVALPPAAGSTPWWLHSMLLTPPPDGSAVWKNMLAC